MLHHSYFVFNLIKYRFINECFKTFRNTGNHRNNNFMKIAYVNHFALLKPNFSSAADLFMCTKC